ncbi:MAG: type IX secretion system membrane protein PorP/SprF [Bacteroidales bacterium]|nr:type IX secretion system membrane protein PorP/SprF [Bacteroidales bacterium]MCF8390413.1 type IX secretion system membrane protein PorP/SprF [Bacteroidales bacterium]
MNIIKNIFIASLFLLSGSIIYAQQVPVFSQYMVNKFLINPAVVGGTGHTSFDMVARQQYTGFLNSPSTFGVSAHSRLLNDSYIMQKLRIRKNTNQATRFTNVGVGGSIYSDRNGIISKTGIQGAYAYHINFNNQFQLSMGLSASVFQYKLDDSDASLINTDDPLLLGEKKQFWVPDASFGTFITNNIWYAGLTITDLLGSSLKLGSAPIKDNFSTMRNYILMGGYRFPINQILKLEPSILFKTTTLSSQLDINAKLSVMNSYWLGFSYRSDNTFVSMLGVEVDIFHFAYAYDASFGSVRNYASGSHELIMGVKIGDNSTRRFRWLRKDEMEFNL